MVDLILTLIGFVPLIAGATLLVDGAASLARRRSIPDIIIGLTIVAFGTSAPEMIVNFMAAAQGNSGFSYGNIIGSNIINILLILGLSAAILPVVVRSATTWIEVPLCLLSAVVLLVISNDVLIDSASASVLSRIDGILLVGFFIVFIYYSVYSGKGPREPGAQKIRQMSVRRSVLFVVAGILLLGSGGQMIIYFASRFASGFGISERIIGLTILSVGTSLPELTTSIIAAVRKNADISMGNIIGSNIFNAFFILGISSIISPIPIEKGSNIDLLVNVFAILLVFIFIFIRKGRMIDRREGIFMVMVYVFYMAFILM
ncbi:MAG: calcium/sodium antiporter [Bacteroidales bacterium]|nr:calcium/sodium antiporter [Bacteroidales bacterium]